MTNTDPTAATRTVTLTVRVPEGARWQTTDEDGTVRFWMSQPESISKGCRWHNAGLLGITETFLPCPHWRDTLTDLAPKPATKETT